MNKNTTLLLTLFLPFLAGAQTKIKDGTVPGTSILPHSGAIIELESANKGLLLTRVSLSGTSSWGLQGSAVAGMTVFNYNTAISSGNPAYPVIPGGVGPYTWDGTGWVALRYGAEPWFVQGTSGQATQNVENIYQTGSVAIGGNTVPAGYKLSVKGWGIAEKLVVKLNTDWPDYVFSKAYSLRPLEEVENFVIAHSHLPEMPSAKDVSRDGQDLGEMNRLLLQKVEELTLYLISQQKTLQSQQSQIVELKESINSFKIKKKGFLHLFQSKRSL